ncbi:MAG TPA: hypothetical protein VH833_01775 [Gemmatimonadales bacterium]
MSAVLRHASVLLVAGLLLTGVLQAQRGTTRGRSFEPVRLGPHIGYNFDADALTLGAQVTLPLSRRVELYPTFDYYAISPGSAWALNADVKYRPPTRAGALYVGGGFGYLRTGTTGDVNVNLVGGMESLRRAFVPYAEGRITLGNGSAFQVVGGVSFKLR